jgi:peptidoglycan/LPS O-acetylase OafA/YrhL
MDATTTARRIGLSLGFRPTVPKLKRTSSDQRPPAGDVIPTYLPWLDLLRFVACLMVIVSHINPYDGVGHLGHTGVGLFFSISGFLIGSVLMNGRGKPAWQATFYANRLLRIYPPLLVALLFFGGLIAFGFGRSGMWESFRSNLAYYLTFTAHLSPNQGEPFGIVWTLCVEEYFYLLLPIAFWMFRARGVAIVLIGIVAVTCLPRFEVLPGTNDFGTWYLIPVNLLAGAVLATFRPRRRDGWLWLGIVGLFAVLANGLFNVFHPFGLVMGAMTTFVVWSFATTRVRVPSSLGLTTAVGKWSYGIYLFHLPFCSAALLICRLCGLDRLGTIGYFTVAGILATLGASMLAGIMYKLWERPILSRRKWITERPWARTLAMAVQASLVPAGIVIWLLRNSG